MKMIWAGLLPAIVLLAGALGPPEAKANWWGRHHCGYYSPRYSYGYSSYYRPTYYGYSNYGYSNYGYGGNYGYSNPYGYASNYAGYGNSFGGGLGGNSALTTILAMSGGMAGANSSMYMTVPMSNGYGPASLLQVPLGGAAGRPTYLQVPMGGGPGQPVYLQMELGAGSGGGVQQQLPLQPAPVPPTPRSVGASYEVYSSDRVTSNDTTAAYEDVASDDAAAPALPFVVLRSSPPDVSNVATAEIDDATTVETALPLSVARGPFHFAVFEKPMVEKPAAATPPTVTTSKQVAVDVAEAPTTEPTLSDSSVPWKVK